MTPTINPSPASRITVARNVTNQTACTKQRGGSKSKHLVQPAQNREADVHNREADRSLNIYIQPTQNREADLSINIYITACTKQRGGS